MNERMRIMEKSVCEPMKFRLYFSFCFSLFFNPPPPPHGNLALTF